MLMAQGRGDPENWIRAVRFRDYTEYVGISDLLINVVAKSRFLPLSLGALRMILFLLKGNNGVFMQP